MRLQLHRMCILTKSGVKKIHEFIHQFIHLDEHTKMMMHLCLNVKQQKFKLHKNVPKVSQTFTNVALLTYMYKCTLNLPSARELTVILVFGNEAEVACINFCRCNCFLKLSSSMYTVKHFALQPLAELISRSLDRIFIVKDKKEYLKYAEFINMSLFSSKVLTAIFLYMFKHPIDILSIICKEAGWHFRAWN